MTRYAYVRNDQVVTVFETDRPASDFPDLTLEVVGPAVRDNMVRDGVGGFKIADPVVNLKEERRQAYIASLNAILTDVTVIGRVRALVQALKDKEG
jgi:hypothetical protein